LVQERLEKGKGGRRKFLGVSRTSESKRLPVSLPNYQKQNWKLSRTLGTSLQPPLLREGYLVFKGS
jgi:hypothetical protein